MRIPTGFAIAIAAFLAALLLWVGAAGAQDYDDDPRYVWIKRHYRVCDLFGCRPDWEWRKVRRSTYGYGGGYYIDRRREDSGPECLQPMTNVSNQHQSETNAKEGAIRNWQSLVRFHYGEKFIDIDRARDVRFMCSQSSVADTVSGKIGDALGVTHYRCEITAIPCRPSFSRGDARGDTR